MNSLIDDKTDDTSERGLRRRRENIYKEESLSERLQASVILATGNLVSKASNDMRQMKSEIEYQLYGLFCVGQINNYEVDCTDNCNGSVSVNLKVQPTYLKEHLFYEVKIKCTNDSTQ